jgi:hypothetical protein
VLTRGPCRQLLLWAHAPVWVAYVWDPFFIPPLHRNRTNASTVTNLTAIHDLFAQLADLCRVRRFPVEIRSDSACPFAPYFIILELAPALISSRRGEEREHCATTSKSRGHRRGVLENRSGGFTTIQGGSHCASLAGLVARVPEISHRRGTFAVAPPRAVGRPHPRPNHGMWLPSA